MDYRKLILLCCDDYAGIGKYIQYHYLSMISHGINSNYRRFRLLSSLILDLQQMKDDDSYLNITISKSIK